MFGCFHHVFLLVKSALVFHLNLLSRAAELQLHHCTLSVPLIRADFSVFSPVSAPARTKKPHLRTFSGIRPQIQKPTVLAVQRKRWKQVSYALVDRVTGELYDMTNDPEELEQLGEKADFWVCRMAEKGARK